MAATTGPTNITYVMSPIDGSMTIVATQVFADGSQVPLNITIPAYKVALFYTVVVTFVTPAQYVVPNGQPSNADVARLVATYTTINNAPPTQVTPVMPAPTSVPPVAIPTGS